MKKTLLVLPSYRFLYESTIIRAGAVYSPILSLATIASSLISRGMDVDIVDLNKSSEEELVRLVKKRDTGYAGITFTTPLAKEAFRLARIIKEARPDVVLMSGGHHSSAMPLDVLKFSYIDVACLGEGDYILPEIVSGKPYKDIEGIAFHDGDRFSVRENKLFIKEMDDLPFPAWQLFDLKRYKTTKLLARNNPVAMLETSRGCPYKCVYCSKKTFGNTFRPKSVKRVVDEIEFVLSSGFNEIHIIDDCFTFDIPRAKNICSEILRRGIRFSWSTVNGIRVDNIDRELMQLMRRAGCYRVSFGIESGDDEVLKAVSKNQTCDQVRKAVKMSKIAGLEVFGYFMLGLPRETAASMRRTIDFAKELDLDMAKIAITIPLPGTAFFDEMDKEGRLKSRDWAKYNYYVPAREVYRHPRLDWDTIEVYFKQFYREFYFRPSFIARRLIKDIANGSLLDDIKYVMQTKW